MFRQAYFIIYSSSFKKGLLFLLKTITKKKGQILSDFVLDFLEILCKVINMYFKDHFRYFLCINLKILKFYKNSAGVDINPETIDY